MSLNSKFLFVCGCFGVLAVGSVVLWEFKPVIAVVALVTIALSFTWFISKVID